MKVKGISGSLVVTLVLIAIVLIVAINFVITQGFNNFPLVWPIFNQVTGEYDKPAANKLDSAIKCSYFRCTKGCDAEEIKDLEINIDGETKKCKEDLCDPIQKVGKVCGQENAIKPSVTNEGGELLQKEDVPFIQCINFIEEESCGGIKGPQKYIALEKGVIVDKTQDTEACPRVGGSQRIGIKRAIVEPGTYSVWTSDSNIISGGFVTHICK